MYVLPSDKPQEVEVFAFGYSELEEIVKCCENDSKILSSAQLALDKQFGDEPFELKMTHTMLDYLKQNAINAIRDKVPAELIASKVSLLESFDDGSDEALLLMRIVKRINHYEEALEKPHQA
jgi:hypothetical protein